MLNKAPIKVINLKQLYIESLMSRVDTMIDPSEMMRMDYNEFLVFIARISEGVNARTNDLHIKIDKVLGLLFTNISATKAFSYDVVAEKEVTQLSNIRSKSRFRALLIGIRFVGRVQRRIRIRRNGKLFLNVIMAVNYMKKLAQKSKRIRNAKRSIVRKLAVISRTKRMALA